jgi:hypothetical protein
MNKNFGLFATTIVASVVATGALAKDNKAAKAGKASADVCQNNACKGNSECKGHGNAACKGQNECKGHGWIKAETKEACEADGKGKWIAKK